MPTWKRPHTSLFQIRARLRQERGVVLVEFAIVLPILILLILGILYFGRYENYADQATQLAEEGARWASVNTDPSSTGQTLQQYVQSQAQGELASGSASVTPVAVYLYYPTGSSNTVGDSVRACVVSTVSYPFSGFTGASSTIAGTATMRIEQVATAWTADVSPPSACPMS